MATDSAEITRTALALGTLSASLVALYLANAYRRRTRQEVLERRVDAYEALWPALRVAATTRLLGEWAGGPLTDAERTGLFDGLTDWYYGTSDDPHGHGLFISPRARPVYLMAKGNLICPKESIKPPPVRESVARASDVSRARGELSIRQLSILRWVMRFDLDLHTDPYMGDFGPEEIAFLAACDIDVARRPWRKWVRVRDASVAGTPGG